MNKLIGKSIKMRFVEETDAEFILHLCLDERYNQFLSSTNPDIDAQKNWIKKYKMDEATGAQFYFIIERLDGIPYGTVRVYDLCQDSFVWGSWILNEEKTRYAALESAFLVYQFGFGNLGFKKSHFDVRKDNERVVSFHKKMGAVQTGESETDFYFEITEIAVNTTKQRLKKYL